MGETPSTPQGVPFRCHYRGDDGGMGWFCFLESAIHPCDSINVHPDTFILVMTAWVRTQHHLSRSVPQTCILKTKTWREFVAAVSQTMIHAQPSWSKPAILILFWKYPHFWLCMISYFLCRHISGCCYVFDVPPTDNIIHRPLMLAQLMVT